MNDINQNNEQRVRAPVPWAGSGVSLNGETDAKTALQKAGLDWEVEGRPLLTPQGGPEIGVKEILIDTHKAIVRKTDEAIMGVVGVNWEILQPHELFDFFDEMQELGEVKYSSAGSFKNDKLIWIQAEFEESEIVPNDIHKKYLFGVTAFDGTYSIRLGQTRTRVVCWNTMVMAAREAAQNGVSIRHTSSMKMKLAAAKQALMIARGIGQKSDLFQKALTKLRMTDKLWDDFGHQIIPAPEEGKNTTRSDRSRETLLELSVQGIGQDIPGVRGTGYAALNGLTEYVNYERTARGKTDDAKQVGRFQSAVFGSGNKLIQTGVEVLNQYLVDHSIQL